MEPTELDKLIEQHRAMFDDIGKRFAFGRVTDKDLNTPLDLGAKRSEGIKLRLERLTAAREAAVKRYDTEIAAARRELEQNDKRLEASRKALEPAVSKGGLDKREVTSTATRSAGGTKAKTKDEKPSK